MSEWRQFGRLFCPVFHKIIYGTNQLPSGMCTKFCHVRMKPRLGSFCIKGQRQEPCLLKTATKRPFPGSPSRVNHVCGSTRIDSNAASLSQCRRGRAESTNSPSALSCQHTQLLMKPLNGVLNQQHWRAKRKNNPLMLKSEDGVAIVYWFPWCVLASR